MGAYAPTIALAFGIECVPLFFRRALGKATFHFKCGIVFTNLPSGIHMRPIHNVQVHNGDINDMEHYLMPPFVISPSQKYNIHKIDLAHQLCAYAFNYALGLASRDFQWTD